MDFGREWWGEVCNVVVDAAVETAKYPDYTRPS